MSYKLPHERPWRLLLILFAVEGVASVPFIFWPWSGTDAGLTGFPLDDSWIHLVYARALAMGDGFAYNPGQIEAGFTSPLWVMLLAPLHWLKYWWDFPIAYGVKVIGFALGFWSGVLVFRLTLKISALRSAAWLAALLVLVDPSMVFARLSGMEVVLASTLVLWSFEAYFAKRDVHAALAASLAILARPEMATITVLILGLLAFRLLQSQAKSAKWAAILTPTIMTVSLWMYHSIRATGRPLPNTFWAKHPSSSIWDNFSDVPMVFHKMLFELPWFYLGTGLLLFVMGAWTVLRQKNRADGLRTWECAGFIFSPIIFLLGVTWAHHLAQSWPFYWNRYFQPAIPWILIPIAIGAVACVKQSIACLRSFNGIRWATRFCGVAGLAVIALPLIKFPTRYLEQASRFSWNCQNINEMQVNMGNWLAQHTHPNDWIATNDAGAIRYFSNRKTLDMMGLNHSQVLRHGLFPMLDQVRPRFIAAFPSWFPWLRENERYKPVFQVQASRYTICDCAQEVMVAYEILSPGERYR